MQCKAYGLNSQYPLLKNYKFMGCSYNRQRKQLIQSNRNQSASFITFKECLTSFDCSPVDEHYICSFGNLIRIYKSQSETIIGSLQHNQPIVAIKYSIDGSYISSGASGNRIFYQSFDNLDIVEEFAVIVWDARNHQQVSAKLLGHSDAVNMVCFQQENVISGSDDNSIRVWNWRLGQQIKIFQFQVRIIWYSLECSDRLAWIDSHGKLGTYQIVENSIRLVESNTTLTKSVQICIKRYQIISCHNNKWMKFWDVRNFRKLGSLKFRMYNLSIPCVYISPNSAQILVGMQSDQIIIEQVKIFDRVRRKLLRVWRTNVGILRFSYDGRFIQSAHRNQLNIIEITKGQI